MAPQLGISGKRSRLMKTPKTKNKQVSEADAAERKQEIDDWLRTEYAARAKAREIIEEYLEGKDNSGSRRSKMVPPSNTPLD